MRILIRSAFFSAFAIIAVGCSHSGSNSEKPDVPKIISFQSPEGGIFSNAYLIETSKHVVALDATLLESTSKAFRSAYEQTKKPLAAVLLTHGHPDHYNGITNLLQGEKVDVIATNAVDKVIRGSDAAKEKQWTPVFKDEWPKKRTFPNRILADGESLVIDGVRFTVHDLGLGESDNDSYWTVEAGGKRFAFIGDVVLNQVHAYLSDGHTESWLKNLARLSAELKDVEMIYPGHGEPGGVELLEWQRNYLLAYRKNVSALLKDKKKLTDADKKVLVSRMKEFLPNNKLEFLIGLGADAVATELKASAVQ